MDIIDQMLNELGISAPSRKVYLDLLGSGESSARSIAEHLSVARPSVYDHLEPLLTSGLVVEQDKEGKTVFAINDVNDIAHLIEEKKQTLTGLRARFDSERERLVKKAQGVEPKIKFFEGKQGLARILLDMLWGEVEEIRTVWPYEEMLRVLGSGGLEEFNKKRIRHKIALRSIWTKKPKGREHIWKGGDWKVERRYAPSGFSPEMGYCIYGDKVSFLSGGRESYGFIVHSKEFAELKRTEFELLWKSSKV